MEQFTFSNACIDLASEKIDEFLKREKVASKDIIRTKPMIEEALLKYRDLLGENAAFTLRCIKRFGRLWIELLVPGDSFDPFAADESSNKDIIRGVFSGAGTIPAWQYKNGQNILVFSPKKKKLSQMVWLVGACILFLQFGIPAQAIAIAASLYIVLEFFITAAEVFCQQCELVQLSASLNMLDLNTLRKGKNEVTDNE